MTTPRRIVSAHGLALALMFVVALTPGAVRADEGMWPFNNIPSAYLKKTYGWAPDQRWLDHIRLASVRFNNGGSGAFVSPTGLVLTNHHVGANCIQKISSPEHDYIQSGYRAKTAAEEVPCPDLELNVLESIRDVTREINANVKPGMTDAATLESQKQQEARLEKECSERTGLRCNTITLYEGGEHDLYQYRKYTDVRLVAAPEEKIAFFGGDPDNFTYPRWDIDFAIFRIYENGKPVQPKEWLAWKTAGAQEGELVLVSGNPGSTDRMETLAELEMSRDVLTPSSIEFQLRRQRLLLAFMAASPENHRIATRSLFGVENSLKANRGRLEALQDSKLMAKKAADEKALRARVASDRSLAAATGAWEAIAAAEKAYAARFARDTAVARALGGAPMLVTARRVVQYAAEKEKPNDTRLEEFRESNIRSLEFALYSKAPTYPTLEKTTLADSLRYLVEKVGAEDPAAKMILAGKSPEDRASELVDGTKLADPSVRRALVEGGTKAIEASSDPMIVLARLTDALVRDSRQWREDNVTSVEKTAGARIAKAYFAANGKDVYPDATFTLRLAYGPVRGYVAGGQLIPYQTLWGGMYEHSEKHAGRAPYDLPASYLAARAKIDPGVPVNFVTTADTTGGNSGSPTVNTRGEVVGLLFDGNIESLGNDVVYSEEIARSVCVHPAAIITALRKVYGANSIADEIEKPAARAKP